MYDKILEIINKPYQNNDRDSMFSEMSKRLAMIEEIASEEGHKEYYDSEEFLNKYRG